MAVETNTICAIFYLQDLSSPPQALPPHQHNQGIYHLALEHCPQNQVVTLGTLQVSFGSFIGAHEEEQQG